MNKKSKMLIPQYMHQFKCIGTECEDNCCIGWRVIIDEDTYKKYRKCPQTDLRRSLDEKVKRNRSNPSHDNYAKIKMDDKARCPFLEDNMLCHIQKNLGEDYLSLTCSTYPRTFNIVNDVLEKSATMSCPEAARLALLNPEIMEFDEILDFEEKTVIQKKIDTTALSMQNKVEKYFWELRIFSISLLQNREYSVEDRLILLGLFYQKLQEYIDNSKIGEIPLLIGQYTNRIEQGFYREYLQTIPVQNTIQMELLKEIADQKVLQGVSGQRYMQCFSEFLHGINYKADDSMEEIAARYVENYNNYYLPFMTKHEYIMENYLVNYVFKNLFPFSGEKKIFDNYVMLVIHYALIKMHLIGIAGIHKENFSQEDIVKLIQSFAKNVEHNSAYLKFVHDLLLENEFISMAYMAILIKN